jgi:glutathione S-transferase
MRLLFHTPTSPFSRRIRLALAHKGVSVELRDVRAQPENLVECRRLSPLKTYPVFVEEDGRVLGDSTAISHYLDRAYPSTVPLWPSEPREAFALFEISSLVDVALNGLIDLGLRQYSLRHSPAWDAVKGEAVERSQRALDALGQRAAALARSTFCSQGWSAADMWLYTAEAFLGGLRARASTFRPAANVCALGWKLPPELTRWAEQHRARPDVRALD